MTLDELERQSNEPEEIFRRFCRDSVRMESDEHLLALFREAQRDWERGERA